ncbi:hypothetical protein MMC17_006258 [Xylographa soralifera]|nr:hypothetical protein [Xylographa soralifera]
MTLPEKRQAETSADADGETKRSKLEDGKQSQQYPLVTDHVSSTVLISNLPSVFDPWSTITREPHIGEGLISMVFTESAWFPDYVTLKYTSPTFAEAMLYRSAKTLTDRYCLFARLENSPSKPREEASPSPSAFSSTSSENARDPFDATQTPVGGVFGGLSTSNAPKPSSSAFPFGTSFGLAPSAGPLSTSNVGPSTSSSFPNKFGSGATPPGAGAGAKPNENTKSSSTSQNTSGIRAVPHLVRPTAKTAPSAGTQPSFWFGATPTINVPKPTGTHASSTNVFSNPNPSGSTSRAKHPKANNANSPSATPPAICLEREPHPYSAPRETLRSGQACPRCKATHLHRWVCFCDQPLPLNTFRKQNESATKPVAESLKSTEKKFKAFQATCEDSAVEEQNW